MHFQGSGTRGRCVPVDVLQLRGSDELASGTASSTRVEVGTTRVNVSVGQ